MPLIRSSVAALTPYTPGEQPRVPGLIKLNTNENPYPPSPRVGEVLKSFAAERLRLYPDPVATELRAAIAELHGCAIENVFAGNGSDETLALCTRAFVPPGGAVGCFEPSYSLYPVLAAIADVPTRRVALTDSFEWVTPDPGLAPLFFLTTPNAPTGMLYPRAALEAFCESFRGVVLLDEAYADFAPENGMEFAVRYPNVLVSRTLSKSYSLAGIRLGYAIGAAPLIEAMFKIKDSYNLDALTQAIGLAAIRDQAWMRANAAKIIATRERVTRELEKRGWGVRPAATNFVFAKPSGRSAAELFDHLRAKAILVRHFPGPRTGDFLRITIGTDDQMDALLAAI
ncbi:MAG: histidinol-phosphate transaminase [Verrucomicrobia bacterium]|nr:histidinol-phosphate transaminase [Verrucomicrobiota bacterium]